MRPRAIVAIVATTIAPLLIAGWSAAPAVAARTCTWGGTPLNPTGVFKQTPGLPDVVRAAGDNISGLVPALLYDKAGNVVGSENPQLVTDGTEEQNFLFTDCSSPEGLKEGHFSSVIELFNCRLGAPPSGARRIAAGAHRHG